MNITKNNKNLIITIVSTILISSIVIGMSQLATANLSQSQTTAAPEMISLVMSGEGETNGAWGDVNLITLNEGVVAPRDAASGLPTGKRQHKPISITKEIDKATPLIMSAITNNENLPSVVFRFYEQNAAGDLINFYTIELFNAAVASVRQVVFEDPETGRFTYIEQVSFTYQKIIWTWEDGGITAEDDWETPIA